MDYLRWILLAIGVLIVVAVYLWGRSKKRERDFSPLDAANDVPSFYAQKNNEDTWVDGVGPVRVAGDEYVDDAKDVNTDDVITEISAAYDEVDVVEHNEQPVEPEAQIESQLDSSSASAEQMDIEQADGGNQPSQDDVVALFIVADRGDELKGEQILSATFATKLEYGDMKIFHRLDDDQQIMFSMANMKEPGWFDFDNMHELKTRGITLFSQLSLSKDAVETVDEMLVCAHTLANMLGGQLCDKNRQLLNEAMARSLREKAKYFASLKRENLA